MAGALALALVLSGCVKRAPRNEPENQETPAPEQPEKKCGLLCRIQGREDQSNKPPPKHETPDKPSQETKPDKDTGTPWWKPWEKPEQKQPKGKGVHHTVKKGETFWRICNTYRADQKEVAKINGIKDTSQLEVGQKIWIPGADKVLPVPAAPGNTGSTNNNGNYTNRPPVKIPPISQTKGTLQNPLPGGKIVSGFGMRGDSMHEGLDIAAPEGTPILAADDGKVAYEGGQIRGYGNMIIIKHAGNLVTVYAHNSKNLVKTGDFVKRGQKIALVGQTGRASGPHLHFEVRVSEKPVNPEFYLP